MATVHGCSPRQRHRLSSTECQLGAQHMIPKCSTVAVPQLNTTGKINQYGTPLYKSHGTGNKIQQRPMSASVAMQDGYRGDYSSQHQYPATMFYRSGRHYAKRKSAVELLAESKPFYIRSDSIFERLGSTAKRPGDGRNNLTYGDINRHYGTTPHTLQYMHHHHQSRHTNLQNKLRLLLDTDVAKDRINSGRNSIRKFELDGTTSFADEGSPIHIPPPIYKNPTSLYKNIYRYAGEDTCPVEEPLILTENYRPISPPAEYAAKPNSNNNDRFRYNYQRSYSHSQEVGDDRMQQYYAITDFNVSHKSLPDLHTHINRHSPGNLSCCSRGNRSIKSAGESSLNRDSGGSSGPRSEPCYKFKCDINPNAIKSCCNVVTRRDSGSSTQHSSYNTPSVYPPRCKHDNLKYDSSDYLLNFTTPEVPEAFQDDYTPPSPQLVKEITMPRYSSSSSQQHHSSQGYTHSQSSFVQSPVSAPSIDDISPPPIQFKRQRCIRLKNRSRPSQQFAKGLLNNCETSGVKAGHGSNGGSTGVCFNFTRAEHNNIFFPTDFNADHHLRPSLPLMHVVEKAHSSEQVNKDIDRDENSSDNLCDLEKFFDRLGLNDETFHEIYNQSRHNPNADSDSDDSSTVFFSDVSTVDSMRLPDSTETQSQTTQPYRSSEPPSIVERNARIIKWLCNCKKMQFS